MPKKIGRSIYLPALGTVFDSRAPGFSGAAEICQPQECVMIGRVRGSDRRGLTAERRGNIEHASTAYDARRGAIPCYFEAFCNQDRSVRACSPYAISTVGSGHGTAHSRPCDRNDRHALAILLTSGSDKRSHRPHQDDQADKNREALPASRRIDKAGAHGMILMVCDA